MIERLAIERFKSVASLGLACRKVNVFIGAPAGRGTAPDVVGAGVGS